MAGHSQSWRRRTSHLAEHQHGHVTRRQLLALGVPASLIDSWIRSGLLIRVHQGVYAVGYRRVEPVALAMAAVLACGLDALLSHESALALYGLRRWPPMPEVTVPGDRRHPHVRVHRSTTLTPSERTRWFGIPTTRAARAIADMGARLTPAQRTRLVNAARVQHLLSVDEQHALLGHTDNPTRSGLEDAFLRWLDRHGIQRPLVNAILDGHEVDALWPRQRVIVELDAYATHGDPGAFQADRDRDNAHLRLGYRTVRLTRDRLTDETARWLRELLSAR